MTDKMTIHGKIIPANLIGSLKDADMNGDLSAQLEQDGYLLLRAVHDPDAVSAARNEVLNRLAEVDEIAQPARAGIASGRSTRAEQHDDLGAFWRSVSEGQALRKVINGSRISSVMERLFGEPSAHFSFAWLRAMPAGRASPLHIDHPYMNRGSDRLVTSWTPIGAVAQDEGPLYIIEGSHKWPELRDRFEGLDVDRDSSRPGHMSDHPADMAAEHGTRLLTTAFAPGDCLVFGMFTAHASFDNNTSTGKVRISCDTRFQPAADAMDERFSGPNPPAHEGLGYACLSASKPMTAAVHLR
ncbi:phytanoyl-CoA dioxygenase family protein [Pararhizobium sp. IMCC21322]|uniref:phytanoyl-CoA dioxygenase family protein n=1 Tax=Pararhizobium sp. IMCC21322 TaxID=3067903 RepID=UPI002741FE4E|nr:phytanoyl-CoA dioxygenase family protein [Pararhizobium sp. IMCC21322]